MALEAKRRWLFATRGVRSASTCLASGAAQGGGWAPWQEEGSVALGRSFPRRRAHGCPPSGRRQGPPGAGKRSGPTRLANGKQRLVSPPDGVGGAAGPSRRRIPLLQVGRLSASTTAGSSSLGG